MTVTFTRRQVALMLTIALLGEPIERLAKITQTDAADLRRVAGGQLPPTAGVLGYFDLQPKGGNFAWQLQ
jgi:hypothetical protein